MEVSDFMALKMAEAIGEYCRRHTYPCYCENCIFLKETESKSLCRLTEHDPVSWDLPEE